MHVIPRLTNFVMHLIAAFRLLVIYIYSQICQDASTSIMALCCSEIANLIIKNSYFKEARKWKNFLSEDDN